MDNVDKKIISILQQDGRTALSLIGKKLGMSHVAVKKRLDNLCNNLCLASVEYSHKKIYSVNWAQAGVVDKV